MAVQLAHDMWKNPPNLVPTTEGASSGVAPGATATAAVSSAAGKGKKKRVSAASHNITATASSTLANCAFLCTVLSENPVSYFVTYFFLLYLYTPFSNQVWNNESFLRNQW